jgi:hypothetical protein
LTKLPVAFSGGNNARVDPVPMVKPADPALEDVLAAAHVDAQIDRLPDAQVAQLRFLEVAVNPAPASASSGARTRTKSSSNMGFAMPPSRWASPGIGFHAGFPRA